MSPKKKVPKVETAPHPHKPRRGTAKPKKGRTKRIRRIRGEENGAFGARFFAAVLPQMVRECPCPEGSEPVVKLYLGDGTQVDVHSVLGLESRYVVLATYEGTGPDGLPRTQDDLGFEAVPFELILRASVRPAPKPLRLGFQTPAAKG